MTARLERPEQPDLGAGRGQRINNVSQSDATVDAIQRGEGWDFPFSYRIFRAISRHHMADDH